MRRYANGVALNTVKHYSLHCYIRHHLM